MEMLVLRWVLAEIQESIFHAVLNTGFQGLILAPCENAPWQLGDRGQFLLLANRFECDFGAVAVAWTAELSICGPTGYADWIGAECPIDVESTSPRHSGVGQNAGRSDIPTGGVGVLPVINGQAIALAALYLEPIGIHIDALHVPSVDDLDLRITQHCMVHVLDQIATVRATLNAFNLSGSNTLASGARGSATSRFSFLVSGQHDRCMFMNEDAELTRRRDIFAQIGEFFVQLI